MTRFERGISDAFVAALTQLADAGGWWRDVLTDKSLLIAVRNEYLNVYWQGQSIFKITHLHGKVQASTHPKYLLDPDLSEPVSFDGTHFETSELRRSGLIETYQTSTLKKMKRAAGLYASGEKTGVHSIWNDNPAVVDVEIAFSAARQTRRADLATFERDGVSFKLVFWEAKLFSNSELRASVGRQIPVLAQIETYRQILKDLPGVLKSYRRIASNLVALAEMSRGARSISKIVMDVAKDPAKLEMSNSLDLGLVIYGFDKPQLKAFSPHLKRLTDDLGKSRIKLRGKAVGLQL